MIPSTGAAQGQTMNSGWQGLGGWGVLGATPKVTGSLSGI